MRHRRKAEFKDALKELQSDFNSIKAMYENALKETTNVQQSKIVLPKSADGTDVFNAKTITADDVRLIQSIGRKSLNELTEEELKKLENVAQKYYAEMGVKSPFFRRWFGDWRAKDKSPVTVVIANNKIFENATNHKELTNLLKKYLKEKSIYRGDAVNKDTKFNIIIGAVGYNDTISYAIRELHKNNISFDDVKKRANLLGNIKELIESSVLLNSEIINDEDNPNRIIMHTFYTVSKYENENIIVKLKVDEFKDEKNPTKRFYNLNDIEIPSVGIEGSTPLTGTDGNKSEISDINTVSDLFSLVKTYDKDFKPKPCSLVLNKDGTPKVVYHGSSNGGFTNFDTYAYFGKYGLFGNGAYFTESLRIAKHYTSKGKGKSKQIYAVYLNIKNPIDMDAKADVNAWQKAVNKAGFDISFGDGMTNEQIFRQFEDELSYEELPIYEVEEIVRNVFTDMGFDGITHTGGGRVNKDGIRHRVWIAFEPSQIKSTDNFGMFSSWDDDIFYSKEEIEAEEKLFSATDEVKIKFSQKVDAWYNGDLKEDDYFELGDTPLVLKALGTKDLPMVYDMNVMYKMTGGKHSIYKDNIKELPQAINNPIMVFKSSSVNNAYVLVTELSDKFGDAVIVAVHLNRYQDRIRINKIASAYGKIGIENFVNTESERGQLKYVDTKKCQQWSTSRGLQLPKLVQSIAGNDSILQKEDIVNTYFMNYRKNYSSDSVLKSKESTGGEVVENIDRGIRRTAEQVEASYFELKKEVQKKLDEHIKKYGAIKKGEDAVRDARFPAQTLLNFLTPF